VGGLRKHAEKFSNLPDFTAHVLCLRLAVILAHARVDIALPQATLKLKGQKIQWAIEPSWREAHPLSDYLIEEEWRSWDKVGFTCRASP
jgi:exopolyphosphatase/guanosine-5'-triphosphate,3'-diphosphate pyrophosphatase